MHYLISITLSLGLLFSKDMSYKIKKIKDNSKKNYSNNENLNRSMSVKDKNGIAAMGQAFHTSNSRTTRDDTSTIWMERIGK